MNTIVVAFGLASVMMVLGVMLRAKVPFFRKLLLPASVIGGVLGALFMNAVPALTGFDPGVDSSAFTKLVSVMFTFSFIAIGLTDHEKRTTEDRAGAENGGVVRGAFAMGTIWNILYLLTPVIGYLVILLVGRGFDMAAVYGLLIPYGFCQGPGQAATYGTIFEEQYGVENAAQVAITFAIVGFLSAFAVGVPIARAGIRRRIARHADRMAPAVERGYYGKQEQKSTTEKETMHAGNLETLAFHLALMGICYLLALGIARLFALIPVVGASFSGMMFFNGMLAAYLVRFVMKKLGISYLKSDPLLSRITGCLSDYLVVCAFMSVQLTVVGKWLVPILVESGVVTVLTLFFCLYFGTRIGGDNDFERVLGLYGTSTGTVPSGIALVRIVDPRLQTTTNEELGLMNVWMMFGASAQVLLITLAMTGVISLPLCLVLLLALSGVFLLLLKPMHAWNRPTFRLTFRKEKKVTTTLAQQGQA